MNPRFFTLEELCKTDHNIRNVPSFVQVEIIRKFANNILDPIRVNWGHPIIVNSCFRSKELNERIKGSKTSQHMVLGNWCAADITVGSKERNHELFDMILKSGITFDQLIDEKDFSWIHVGLVLSSNNRHQVLHL